jgi:transcriptional regulator with XRE-family HTH domain
MVWRRFVGRGPAAYLPALPAIRRAAGLSKAELARRAGISASTVAHLERQQARASTRMRRRLAAVLGVDPDDLLAETEEPTP